MDEELRSLKTEAVIVIGCVIRGDTPHFDYVCQIAADGVAELNARGEAPVIFGVLTVNNEQQALTEPEAHSATKAPRPRSRSHHHGQLPSHPLTIQNRKAGTFPSNTQVTHQSKPWRKQFKMRKQQAADLLLPLCFHEPDPLKPLFMSSSLCLHQRANLCNLIAFFNFCILILWSLRTFLYRIKRSLIQTSQQ